MEQTEKKTVGSSITDTIVKFRVVIISVLVAAIVVALVIGLVTFFKNNSIEKGLTTLDQIEYKYSALDSASETFDADVTSILAEATEFANDSTGVVSVRSFLFAGKVAFDSENWTEARDAYLSAYEADTEAYTAPIALYNAGICSDELNELDAASEYLNKAIVFDNFSLKPRALFNLGRIEEARNSIDSAVAAYEQAAADYPSSSWAKLSISRKISLTSEK